MSGNYGPVPNAVDVIAICSMGTDPEAFLLLEACADKQPKGN
jgi:hypothetical protein